MEKPGLGKIALKDLLLRLSVSNMKICSLICESISVGDVSSPFKEMMCHENSLFKKARRMAVYKSPCVLHKDPQIYPTSDDFWGFHLFGCLSKHSKWKCT